MTNKNPYEDISFDIPDIVKEKNNETTSTSVDMSIFKMSEEELYDETPETKDDNPTNIDYQSYETKPKKKSKAGIVILVILLIILAATTTVSLIFGLKQQKQIEEITTALENSQAQVKDLENKNKDLDAKVKAYEAEKAAIEAQKLLKDYEVIDGPISFRVAPNKNAEYTQYQNEDYANNGDVFKALEVVKDSLDESFSWIKVADNVYFCIGTAEEPWAEIVEE